MKLHAFLPFLDRFVFFLSSVEDDNDGDDVVGVVVVVVFVFLDTLLVDPLVDVLAIGVMGAMFVIKMYQCPV